MLLIPAGSFQMGSDADDALAKCEKLFFNWDCELVLDIDEEPVHTVYLDDFYIDQYEVTNAQYDQCVAADECNLPIEIGSSTRGRYYRNPQYDDYPVIYIYQHYAKTYCEWRGARLPTEAEWEKAARGGLDSKQYPWGNNFDGNQANFCDYNCKISSANLENNDGFADTAPVGSYEPNDFGLYDMSGNVSEFVADDYGEYYYSHSPRDNPKNTDSNTGQMSIRGGSWFDSGAALRVANRRGVRTNYHSSDIGFRCVRDASP